MEKAKRKNLYMVMISLFNRDKSFSMEGTTKLTVLNRQIKFLFVFEDDVELQHFCSAMCNGNCKTHNFYTFTTPSNSEPVKHVQLILLLSFTKNLCHFLNCCHYWVTSILLKATNLRINFCEVRPKLVQPSLPVFQLLKFSVFSLQVLA